MQEQPEKLETEEEGEKLSTEDARLKSRRQALKAGVLAGVPVLVTVTARTAFANPATAYGTSQVQADPPELLDHDKIYHAKSEDNQKHA